MSIWYAVYRVAMALLFMGGVAGEMVTHHSAGHANSGKFFIFATDLGILFLTIHYLLDACLAVCRWMWEHFGEEGECKLLCCL